jgi:hypothetical protein
MRLRLGFLLVTACFAGALSCSSSSPSGTSTEAGGQKASTPSITTPLFPDDFKGVCQGATVSKAKAYDAKAATGHKVILFQTFKDSLIEQTTQLPSDWRVTFDANADAYAAVDLIACSVRTDATFVKDCDGYQKDGKTTANIAKLHGATYKLTVREATTGKELASKDLTAEADDCPMFVTFEGDSDTVNYYESPPDEAYVDFIKPFVQP